MKRAVTISRIIVGLLFIFLRTARSGWIADWRAGCRGFEVWAADGHMPWLIRLPWSYDDALYVMIAWRFHQVWRYWLTFKRWSHGLVGVNVLLPMPALFSRAKYANAGCFGSYIPLSPAAAFLRLSLIALAPGDLYLPWTNRILNQHWCTGNPDVHWVLCLRRRWNPRHLNIFPCWSITCPIKSVIIS